MSDTLVEFLPLDVGAPWIVPTEDDRGAARDVAVANERIAAAARHRLVRLLPSLLNHPIWAIGEPSVPMVWSADLDTTWLDGAEIVDFLCAHEQVGSERVTFSSGGITGHLPPMGGAVHPRQHPTMSPTKLSGAGLLAALMGGDTAVFNHSDDVHPVLASLAGDVARACGCGVSINSFLTVGSESRGFGGHWDQQDVIVVPLLGRKRWEIAEPLAPNALHGPVPQGYSGRVVATEVLEPGRALVIPRGWCHRVHPVEDGISFHLTIGLIRARGPELLHQIVDRLGGDPDVRADVPPRPRESSATFWDVARDRVTGRDVSAVVALAMARVGTRPFDEVSAVAAFAANRIDGLWLCPRVPAQLVVTEPGPEDDFVVLGANNRAVRVPLHRLPATLELLSAGERSLASVVEKQRSGDGVDADRLVIELVFGGLLTVTRQLRPWLRPDRDQL